MIDTIARATSAIVDIDPDANIRIGAEFTVDGESVTVQAWRCSHCPDLHVKVLREGFWDRDDADERLVASLPPRDVAGSPG